LADVIGYVPSKEFDLLIPWLSHHGVAYVSGHQAMAPEAFFEQLGCVVGKAVRHLHRKR
jgi:hypothetical protein